MGFVNFWVVNHVPHAPNPVHPWMSLTARLAFFRDLRGIKTASCTCTPVDSPPSCAPSRVPLPLLFHSPPLVCTSLGLGVQQLAAGLTYMEKEYRCNGLTMDARATCMSTSTITFNQSGYVGLIWAITAVATFSVVTGLTRGLQYLSLLAMTLCLIIMFFVLFADNTAFLLNVMVQNVGYYIQYVIQAGFDCEAFQQLAYEFDSSSSNLLWGSGPTNLIAKLSQSNIGDKASGSPRASARAIAPPSQPVHPGRDRLALLRIQRDVGPCHDGLRRRRHPVRRGQRHLGQAQGHRQPIPCGSGWNTTHTDAALVAVLGASALTRSLDRRLRLPDHHLDTQPCGQVHASRTRFRASSTRPTASS